MRTIQPLRDERHSPHLRRLATCALRIGGIGLLAGGCGDDDSTEPVVCTDEVTEVEATITTGSEVVFNWSPACAVALLLVEEGASDRWSIGAPDEESNVVMPPVTHGTVPAGAEESSPAIALEPGVTY